MTDNKILMIHDVKYYYIRYLDDKYVLTFDDGLYSVYYYRKKLEKINTTKIIFIPTERILSVRKTTPIFTDCFKANSLWLNYKDNSAYMTIDEVKDLYDMGFIIGCHSHFHKRVYENKEEIEEDIFLTMQWFKKHLKYIPKHFAFPYNNEHAILKHELIKNGIIYFYGRDRIPVETMIYSLLTS